MENKFLDLVQSSERILVITHVGPDPDAFTSMILMGTALQLNFPDKQVVMSTEEQTGDLSVLKGYENIKLQKLSEAIENLNPQLIIMVDSMNFRRCTRGDWEGISNTVKTKGIKLAIIDHHEQIDVEDNDVYINNADPAAVQEVYELLFEKLELKKPDGYAQTTMIGLYSDSGGFIHKNPRYRETFKLVADLTEAGADLEEVNNLINSYSSDEMMAVGELVNNLSHQSDFNYSYISDTFTQKWQADGKDFEELKLAVSHFVNIYIRNIDERKWGFVIYKDLAAGDNIYGVSFRSVSGVKNVADIARRFNGGGHIPAAGAKIQAASVEVVLSMVKKAILD